MSLQMLPGDTGLATQGRNEEATREAREAGGAGRGGGAERGLGWAIVGASYIGDRFMVNAIREDPSSHPAALMSKGGERARQFAARHGIPQVYSSLTEMLVDDAVDIVYIGSTNDLHAPQTIAAAEAGKHVLCEKPLALSTDDALAMCDACDQAGVVLGTNHNKREAPTHRAIRRLVAEGALGDVLSGHIRFATYLPEAQQTWRLIDRNRGAGVVMDLTVHDVDIVRYLLEAEVESVTAVTAQHGLAKGPIEDTVAGVLSLAGGAVVSFSDTFTLRNAGTALEIHGTDASIFAEDVMGDLPTGTVSLRNAAGIQAVPLGPCENLFAATVRRFNDAARGRGEPSASGRDGAHAVAVALAALASAETGRRMRPGYRSGCEPTPIGGGERPTELETMPR